MDTQQMNEVIEDGAFALLALYIEHATGDTARINNLQQVIIERMEQRIQHGTARKLANMLPEPQKTESMLLVMNQCLKYCWHGGAIEAAALFSEPLKEEHLSSLLLSCLEMGDLHCAMKCASHLGRRLTSTETNAGLMEYIARRNKPQMIEFARSIQTMLFEHHCP